MTLRRIGANALLLAGVLLLTGPVLHFVTRVRSQRAPIAAARRVADPARPGPPAAPAAGEAWGRMELPRLGLDLVVFEGASADVLRKGPGHVPGTACPERNGTPGNCVIAGHRDTFFRSLSRAREGDLVRLSGNDGAVSTYRLGSRRIVRPEEVSVLAPSSDRRLTLITCYPFSWLGSAPYRLVWSAAAIDDDSLASVAVRNVPVPASLPAQK